MTGWPKSPPPLSPEQLDARERFILLWHEQLPARYAMIEAFNQGFPASLELAVGTKTLEIGAGIGAHLEFEDLGRQEYHVLELREEFCERLRMKLEPERVHCGNIEQRTAFPDVNFGRIIAIHMLEHLRDLPSALVEVDRLLRDDGFFDVVLPCEGGLVYSLARAISAKPLFERTFKMDYEPIIRNEHVSTLAEIKHLLLERFQIVTVRRFPLQIPSDDLSLCIGYRFRKRFAAILRES